MESTRTLRSHTVRQPPNLRPRSNVLGSTLHTQSVIGTASQLPTETNWAKNKPANNRTLYIPKQKAKNDIDNFILRQISTYLNNGEENKKIWSSFIKPTLLNAGELKVPTAGPMLYVVLVVNWLTNRLKKDQFLQDMFGKLCILKMGNTERINEGETKEYSEIIQVKVVGNDAFTPRSLTFSVAVKENETFPNLKKITTFCEQVWKIYIKEGKIPDKKAANATKDRYRFPKSLNFVEKEDVSSSSSDADNKPKPDESASSSSDEGDVSSSSSDEGDVSSSSSDKDKEAFLELARKESETFAAEEKAAEENRDIFETTPFTPFNVTFYETPDDAQEKGFMYKGNGVYELFFYCVNVSRLQLIYNDFFDFLKTQDNSNRRTLHKYCRKIRGFLKDTEFETRNAILVRFDEYTAASWKRELERQPTKQLEFNLGERTRELVGIDKIEKEFQNVETAHTEVIKKMNMFQKFKDYETILVPLCNVFDRYIEIDDEQRHDIEEKDKKLQEKKTLLQKLKQAAEKTSEDKNEKLKEKQQEIADLLKRVESQKQEAEEAREAQKKAEAKVKQLKNKLPEKEQQLTALKKRYGRNIKRINKKHLRPIKQKKKILEDRIQTLGQKIQSISDVKRKTENENQALKKEIEVKNAQRRGLRTQLKKEQETIKELETKIIRLDDLSKQGGGVISSAEKNLQEAYGEKHKLTGLLQQKAKLFNETKKTVEKLEIELVQAKAQFEEMEKQNKKCEKEQNKLEEELKEATEEKETITEQYTIIEKKVKQVESQNTKLEQLEKQCQTEKAKFQLQLQELLLEKSEIEKEHRETKKDYAELDERLAKAQKELEESQDDLLTVELDKVGLTRDINDKQLKLEEKNRAYEEKSKQYEHAIYKTHTAVVDYWYEHGGIRSVWINFPETDRVEVAKKVIHHHREDKNPMLFQIEGQIRMLSPSLTTIQFENQVLEAYTRILGPNKLSI